ncbi:MAG: ABC transporter permease, partial [Methylococcaceae bacterium]|nr:ABC transporter permease [Methylococcaceae bacterium]
SAGLILLVAWGFGLTSGWVALWVLPVAFLAGLCFGGMALLVTSYAYSYDFFVYYISLLVTPLILLRGVFFPLDSMPDAVRIGSAFLPLQPVVNVMRALVSGHWQWHLLPQLAVPMGFALVTTLLAIRRFNRRLLE